jgi:hypothetical protein
MGINWSCQMIDESLAETKWCPFALVQSAVKECDFSGQWIDTRITGVANRYETDGKIIAVAAINRTAAGEPNPDCLCLTKKCVFWRDFGDGQGDCSKLNDNMNTRFETNDATMEAQWCPNARPENEVVTRPWNGTISGCTNALSSANRTPGNAPHPSSLCITNKCMAYTTNGGSKGYCMHADKNMQG